jgi:fumarate reductase flavoprotein subunit
MELGVPFVGIVALGNSYPVWHTFETDGRCGPNLIDVLVPQAEALGATFRYNTAADTLLFDDNGVTGVLAANVDGVTIRIDAKAVILCSGGYADNAEMLAEYANVPDMDMIHNFGIAGRDGDGINMALSAHAALQHPGAVMYCGALVEGTGIMHDFLNLVMCFQPNLYVNESASRFFNEGIVFDFTTFGNALSNNSENYSIIDDAYIDVLESVGIFNGHPTSGNPTGTKLSDVRPALQASNAIVIADTLEELADGLGIDAKALAATVEHYNDMCAAGIDADYAKDSAFLQPVKTAPFYGTKVKRTYFATVGGLKVDEHMRVLTDEGGFISGLYACGGDANGAYGSCYDVGVTSGSQQGWAGTSGRLAAEHAASVLLD